VPAGQPQAFGSINRIRFPEPWLKMRGGEQTVVNDNLQYVIRKSADELIFTVKQGFDARLYGKDAYDFPVRNPDYDYYSDNHFAVSLDGKFSVRKASDSEWATAAKPLHGYRFIDSFKNPQVKEEGITYNDRLYRKTGDSWGTQVALVSPYARWIAVFSFTSPDKPQPALIPGFGGNGPSHGEVFLDIYDTSSGDKVVAGNARFGDEGSGVSPSLLFGNSVWIDDRYLIVPLNSFLQNCYLVTLPDK
jgi:hypothetical protein